MTQATRHDATRPVPHTLQHQLAAHFSEIAALHGAWMAVSLAAGWLMRWGGWSRIGGRRPKRAAKHRPGDHLVRGGALAPAVHVTFDHASHLDGDPVAEMAALAAGFGLSGLGIMWVMVRCYPKIFLKNVLIYTQCVYDSAHGQRFC